MRTVRAGAILMFALGVIAAPGATFAAEPQINVEQLATAERALKFCGPVDPDSSKKLQEKVAQMIKGTSPASLARMRASEDYKKAYATMDSFITQIDPRNAKVACTNSADPSEK